SAVEMRKPMRIIREMARNPIEQHSETGAVTGLDQRGKIGGAAEPAGRREQTGRLISPRAVERMLADRQEFDMGKSQIADIGRQLVGELAIAQPASILRATAPGTQMHLIDRNRSRARVDVRRCAG